MAGTSVGEIGLDLVVNQGQFKKQMAGVQGMAKKAGLALAAAFSVKKLVDFGKECLELGSDLAEVQNVVDVTFPSMKGKVDEFAKSAAQSFGLSETMAKKFTGTFGSMAKAFGFSEKQAYEMGSALTGLAGDVASFYNLSQEEAYTKLKSVFTGETESLKDLGVVMTQTALDSYAMANGFGKTTKEMSEAEKVALRYQFVTSRLGAAQGDFARTSGSWANQVRILKLQFDSLKATIGQGLINLFTPIIKVVNSLIGKLATLANAFKSFTELITGNKSSGTSQVTDMGEAAGAAGEGMAGAASSADDMADSSKKAGQAAKKAAKEMRSLMGFDKINKLDDNSAADSSEGSGGSAPSTGGGAPLGSIVDFGNLAEGETVVDKMDKRLEALIKRAKELAKLFKKGFKIGFGDSEKKIKSIIEGFKGIGKSLRDIATDKNVVTAFNGMLDSFAMSAGKIAGSFARIGLTIADNLIGGIDKYLSESSEYIKGKLISMFNVSGEIAELKGDFMVAVADIFDVFSGDTAKSITGHIIGIFSDGFLGAMEVGLKFVRDLTELIVLPITQNVDGIKTAIENTLGPIETVLDTMHQSVKDTFDKISQTYDQYVKPFIDSVSQGISDIVNTFLEGYNTYIAPVLDTLGEKFSTVWQEHIQPAINQIIETLGKVFELLTVIWKNVLQPFINWIVKTIIPILAPILLEVGTIFMDLLGTIGDVINGIMKVLGGLIDFVTGVFTGDWKKAWKGIEEIAEGFKLALGSIFKFVKEYVLQPIIDFVQGIFERDWSASFGTIGTVMDTFLDGAKKVWAGVRREFNGIIEFVEGIFTGNWEQAWQGIQDIFGGIFDGMIGLAKTPINAVIDLVNGLLNTLNDALSAVERAFTFDWGFRNPITGNSHRWHFGMNLPSIPTIPHLAQGGFVEKNTPQLAMIGDNRHQGEIVAPENKLQEMVDAAVRGVSGGISREELETIINRAVMRIVTALADMGFYLDSTQVATAVRTAQQSMDVRYNAVGVD